LPLSGLDVGQFAKAIHLQLEDKLIRIERFKAAGKQYGPEVSMEHARSIAGTAFLPQGVNPFCQI